jgi:HSP20 family protein
MNENIANESGCLLTPLATVPAGQRSTGDADWFPAVDILEDAQEYLFKIDLPEVKPEDIHITVEEDWLVIAGDRATTPPPAKQCLRVERPSGHFQRRFTLPEDASREEIEPFFRECVLELHVRKVSPAAQIPTLDTSATKLRLVQRQE